MIKNNMKEAVSIIVQNKEGKYLAVSRKDNYEDFGLPGGSVEEGEAPADAIRREVKEETTLQVYNLILIYSEIHNNTLEHTYIGKVQGIVPDIQPEGEGVIKWLDKEEIFKGSFGAYNRKVIEMYENKF